MDKLEITETKTYTWTQMLDCINFCLQTKKQKDKNTSATEIFDNWQKINSEETDQCILPVILSRVCALTGVKLKDLKGKSRKTRFVRARKVYFYVAKDLTDYSLARIGYEIFKAHTSVLHHLKKIDEGLEFDEKYQLSSMNRFMKTANEIILEFK